MADTRQIAAEAVQAFNAHDEAGIRATYADDVVFEAPGDVRIEDADRLRNGMAERIPGRQAHGPG